MNRKSILAALTLATVAAAAQAGDQTIDFTPADTASFIGTGPLLQGGDDVITFDGLASGTYDFELTLSGQNILLRDLFLNGVQGSVISNGHFLFADVFGTGTTPFALTLDGVALGRHANYSGELSVSAVPEPMSGAMLVAGLVALGLVARRRQAAGGRA